MGAVYRGGVVAVATARPIFACRIRRSAVRRTVPSLTARVGSLKHSRGSFLPRRASPGTPPACEGPGIFVPAPGKGGFRRSSRPRRSRRARGRPPPATPGGLPRAVIFLYLACSRCCAFQDRASVSGGLPGLPAPERGSDRRPVPVGPCRLDQAGVGPVLAGSAGRGRRRADVVKYWTGYCAGPGWSPARQRRCSRTWRTARYGRSSSRTTVLGLVLSLRPSAIRVLNGR